MIPYTLILLAFLIWGMEARMPKDSELNRVLRDVLRDHERTIRGIEKALR